MNVQMTGIGLLGIPSVVLILGWTLLRQRKSRGLFGLVWGGLIIATSIIGSAMWNESHECTRLAAAAMATSTIWFSGPILLWTIRRNQSAVWSWLVAILLPFASFMACFFLLAATGQVWGM
jgi:hypothetical protein